MVECAAARAPLDYLPTPSTLLSYLHVSFLLLFLWKLTACVFVLVWTLIYFEHETVTAVGAQMIEVLY